MACNFILPTTNDTYLLFSNTISYWVINLF